MRDLSEPAKPVSEDDSPGPDRSQPVAPAPADPGTEQPDWPEGFWEAFGDMPDGFERPRLAPEDHEL